MSVLRASERQRQGQGCACVHMHTGIAGTMWPGWCSQGRGLCILGKPLDVKGRIGAGRLAWEVGVSGHSGGMLVMGLLIDYVVA